MIVFIVYAFGFVYLTIVWQLGSVVSILEDSYGIKAVIKSGLYGFDEFYGSNWGFGIWGSYSGVVCEDTSVGIGDADCVVLRVQIVSP
ncbi:hypothetical protein ACS0TY_017521 [Phlomoides rotata]